jgi:hypothetical protein
LDTSRCPTYRVLVYIPIIGVVVVGCNGHFGSNATASD